MITTIDFDDTLRLPKFDTDENLWLSSQIDNAELIHKIKLVKPFCTVILVTSRFDNSLDEVKEWVKLHNLDIQVIGTNGKLKDEVLVNLGSDLHVDDDVEQVTSLQLKGIQTILVPHPLDDINRVELENLGILITN